MKKGFRIWCKGNHPTNKNFQKEGWWNCGDYILNKYYDVSRMFDGFYDDAEFFKYFEIHKRE